MKHSYITSSCFYVATRNQFLGLDFSTTTEYIFMVDGLKNSPVPFVNIILKKSNIWNVDWTFIDLDLFEVYLFVCWYGTSGFVSRVVKCSLDKQQDSGSDLFCRFKKKKNHVYSVWIWKIKEFYNTKPHFNWNKQLLICVRV